jgi:N-methylhydantoinase B
VRKRAVSLTMGALAQIIPDLVCGDLCGSSFPNAIGGWNKRRDRQYVYYESPAGGNGGFAGGDGPDAFVNIDFGNLPSIHNVESIENEMPLLVESCALRIDGGGEGRQRGGAGMVRRIRVLDDEASYSVLSDRAVLPPWGVHGGSSAAPYHLSIERDGETITFDTPGKVTGYPVYRDDVVVMRSSGGGGYGDPLERDADLVRRDVAFGVVSAERAAEGYCVVLDAAGAVDTAATDAARAMSRGRRHGLRVVADDTIEAYAGAKGKRRIVPLSAEDAAALGARDGDLIELLGANPAPLRGWARIVEGPAGELRLDAFARRVLRCEDGDTIRVRRLAMPPLPKGMAG